MYPTVGNFITVVGRFGESNTTSHMKKFMKVASPLPVEAINAPASLRGIDFSDHRNYWHFNFPAVMITDTSFFRNPNYHQESDAPETLDYEKMSDVVKGVAWAVLNL